MKKVIFILTLSLISCRCSPVKETVIDQDKRISDLSASNWNLRSLNANKDMKLMLDSLTIKAYKDTLQKCRDKK